ncbi:MAG TPA: serine hydrolase [Microlunatus sp.]
MTMITASPVLSSSDPLPAGWRVIGGPAHSLAVHGDRLAALTPDRGAVWSWNPTDETWGWIGGPGQRLVSGGWDLHSLTPDVWRWDGRAWSSTGSPGSEFVAIGGGLYALAPKRDAVLRYDRYDNSWTKIGGPAAHLVGGGSKLYAIGPDGSIVEYSRFERKWTRIGGPGAQFVGVGATVYALRPDRSAVFRYDGAPDQWTRVGGPAAFLIGGGSVLYATQPGTGSVWRYAGSGETWEQIGPRGTGFVATGRSLYALTPDRSAVLAYEPMNSETRRLRTLMNATYTGAAYEGRMRRGFLVKRLGGPVIAEHQAGTIFQPLSVLKLLPYAHALMQIDRGRSTLDTMVSWPDPTPGSGPLRDVLPTTMWFSHNRSLEAVMNHYSVVAITRNAQQLGLRETEMYLGNGDGTPAGWWAHNLSTLHDLARLLEGIEQLQVVSADTRGLFRRLMIERTPGAGTSYVSPILHQTAGPESSAFLRPLVEKEAGGKLPQVKEFMKHVVIRFKAGGGNPAAGEFGYGEFFTLTLPFKGQDGTVVPTTYLLGWYLNQVFSEIIGPDSPELAAFKNAMFRTPIREALKSW